MYVHRTDGPGEPWTVGHYDPQGNWHPASDWATQEEAADEVARLNGPEWKTAADVEPTAGREYLWWHPSGDYDVMYAGHPLTDESEEGPAAYPYYCNLPSPPADAGAC